MSLQYTEKPDYTLLKAGLHESLQKMGGSLNESLNLQVTHSHIYMTTPIYCLHIIGNIVFQFHSHVFNTKLQQLTR